MLITPEAEKLFNEALTLAPDAREAYLKKACQNNPELFNEVSSLLTAAKESEAYFDNLSDQVGLSALANADEAAIAGKILGQWKLVSLLGRGGMGAVYLAERADGQFEKQVALKTLPIGLDNELAHTRFLNERQILAQLVHDNIARLLDGGVSEDGTPYFVMDYVVGERIDSYSQQKNLSLKKRVDLLIDVARGVQFAHRNLIIHRDLKPSNILVNESGQPRLLDFGIAKVLEPTAGGEDLTQMAQRPVTPAYASPEMLRGEPVDVTTDVYSLGAVLYQLLTGSLPLAVDGLTLAELHAYVGKTVPVAASKRNSEIDSDLDAIIAKALAKFPSERYESVESLVQDLGNWRSGLPVTAKAPSALYRAGKFVRRNLAAVSLASIAVVSLAGFAAIATYSAARSEQQALTIAAERDRAEATKNFLVSIFDSAGPKSGGETLTATQILEAGRIRVKEELSDQPRLQADMLGTIAFVYSTMGVNDKWSELLYEQKELVAKLDGEQSQAYFDMMFELAKVEDQLGRYDAVEKIANELIAISEVLGNPANEGIARGRLGRIYHLKGNYEGADIEYRNSLQLFQAAFGNDDMRTAAAKLDLGTLLNHMQDPEAAYAMFLDVEQTHKRVKKDKEVIQTDLYLGMARSLAGLERYDDALKIYQQTFDANERLYGKDYIYNLYIVNGMSAVALAKNDFPQALELQNEMLRMSHKYMPESPIIGKGMLYKARIYQLSGQCELAIPVFRKALAIFAERLPDHSVVGEAKYRLGACLGQFGQDEEAEALLIEGLDILKTHLKPDHKDVADAKASVEAFYEARGT
ncbi:MAG: tetratricopeptide repeat protein [Gammaproteobacteria bacterium]